MVHWSLKSGRENRIKLFYVFVGDVMTVINTANNGATHTHADVHKWMKWKLGARYWTKAVKSKSASGKFTVILAFPQCKYGWSSMSIRTENMYRGRERKREKRQGKETGSEKAVM